MPLFFSHGTCRVCLKTSTQGPSFVERWGYLFCDLPRSFATVVTELHVFVMVFFYVYFDLGGVPRVSVNSPS